MSCRTTSHNLVDSDFQLFSKINQLIKSYSGRKHTTKKEFKKWLNGSKAGYTSGKNPQTDVETAEKCIRFVFSADG
jgi:hypothetical protein